MLDSGIIGDVITFRTILGNSGPEGWSLEGTWFFDKNKAAMGALSDMGIHKVGPDPVPAGAEGHRDHRQGSHPE